MDYSLLMLFLLFFIYSFLGWSMEMIFCFYTTKKWVNRGFFIGPICPIYGCGCLLIILLLNKYTNDPFVLFVMSMLVCSLLEYFTSYIMEKLFDARWWDYSDKKYNINGRICLENIFAFGILGLAMMYVINPFIVKLLSYINANILNAISLLLLILFVVDLSISLKVISGFKNVAKSIHKDSTEEITKKVREILSKRGRLYKRLVSAFDFEASEKLINDIKEKVKDVAEDISGYITNSKNKKNSKILKKEKKK